MDAERWKSVESLYHAAMSMEPTQRSAFLDATCPADAELRHEVESLIACAEHAEQMLPDDARPCGAIQVRAEIEGFLDRSLRVTEATLKPGEVLCDRFCIVRLLGMGGMGEVYEAEDRMLGESIALKTIRPDIVDRDDVRVRFVREVNAAKKVAHPNICRIHDLHQHRPPSTSGAEIAFITMELLHGETLRARLSRGALPLAEARPIAKQLADALEAAHRAGVVHRDFKSENVMLVAGHDEGARAVVTDFGLARSHSTRTLSSTLSGAGQIVGTPAYMAPEQLLGEKITPAVDIYALGVVLYEMVTGIQPFTGNSPLAIAARKLDSPPPAPRVHSPDLSPQWETAILGCLERDPAKRFAHPSDIWKMIAGEATASAANTSPARRVFISRNAIVAAALLLAIAGVSRNFWKPFLSHSERGGSRTKKEIYLAVLPFKPLGDRPTLHYQTEGIADAVSARLFQLPRVHLASRAAVDDVKNESPARIARRLGVKMLLSGSVEGSADRNRITVVVNLEDGDRHTVWADRFSGTENDLLTLEDGICDGLIRALNVSVSGDELARGSAHPTENMEAYDLYLEGRFAIRQKRDEASVMTALDLYKKALAKDPHFGLAYAALADASMFMYDLKKESFWTEKALHAAAEAEHLRPGIAESHIAMGSAYRATGRTDEAISEFQHALELAPNSDEAYRRLASAFKDAGRKASALQYFHKAIDANPYYWGNYNQLGWALLNFGEYNQALENFRKVTEIAPDLPNGYTNLGVTYLRLSQYEEAVQQYQKSIQLKPTAPAYANLADGYYHMGRYRKALEAAEQAVALNQNDDLAVGNLADAYRWLGQPEQAQKAYERAINRAYAALEVNPKDAAVMARLALYYAKKGQDDRARECIDSARALDADNAELIFDRAVIESLSGNQSVALRYLRQAVERGYSIAQIESEPDLAKLRLIPAYRASLPSEHAARR
jgi:serine/threonine-protein kinase